MSRVPGGLLSQKKQNNRRHVAVLYTINLPLQFIPKLFSHSDIKFGMRVVTQANWNTAFLAFQSFSMHTHKAAELG